jgi:hypothetical protein
MHLEGQRFNAFGGQLPGKSLGMGSAAHGFTPFSEPDIPFSTEVISDILEIISLYGKRNINFPPGSLVLPR